MFNNKIEYRGLRRDLKMLPDGFVVLIISTPEKYETTNIEILKVLCNEEKLLGLYITVSHPYSAIFEKLSNKGIDVDRLFFVDLITKTSGDMPERTKNCLFISSPENISDLGVIIDEAVYAPKDNKKFLFLDSVSSLLIYNSLRTVKNFEEFITRRMRKGGIKGILISVGDDDEKEIIEFLAQFCDKVLSVK